ncbi:hypothetical protein [Flectobacillus roseus]|uniref:Uncharacterized protein n=1 Tax=Flectobacillus roseus TaxID=502259 RepID=A0ABT6Y480_9BACT|nr:hypothetical protein [Flectobacillus roseus]MDI9857908.1 hypothetical protein [Flectobacillus roseus]
MATKTIQTPDTRSTKIRYKGILEPHELMTPEERKKFVEKNRAQVIIKKS